MVVKVYGYLQAACPQRVLLCFLEKEIEFEVIHVDLDTLEHKKPEHLLRQVNIYYSIIFLIITTEKKIFT